MSDESVQDAVLTRNAIGHNVEPGRLSLGEKGGVFCLIDGQLRCLCQQGSRYWNELEAEVFTTRALARAIRR